MEVQKQEEKLYNYNHNYSLEIDMAVMKNEISHIDRRFDELRNDIREGFENINKKFDKIDAKFDKIDAKFTMMYCALIGVLFSGFALFASKYFHIL